MLPPLKPRRFRYPGRKAITHRQDLTGIIFVLRTGIPWELLPKEMGCGSGVSCWRRLRDWQAAGVWQKIHGLMLDELGRNDELDLSIVAADSGTVRAVGAGEKRDRIPRTDAIPKIRGKVGAPLFRPEAVVADKAYTWTSNIVSLGIAASGLVPREGHRPRPPPRHLPMGGRTHHRLAAPVPAAARPLRTRADILQAFLSLGCALICHRYLKPSL